MIIAPAGFLTANAALVKKPIYLIEIAGYSRKFTNRATGVTGQYSWLISVDDQTTSVSEQDGGADLGELTFTVQDRGGVITADFPGFTFEGKVITLKTGFAGQPQSEYALLFTGVIDTVSSTNANSEYVFACTDGLGILSKVIYTVGDDDQPTDGDHLRTLNAHPLDILLDILNTEVGLASDKIDTVKIEAYRDSIFAGVQFQFEIDSPPAAKDFIENQLMKPMGGYLWVNNGGKVSVNFFYPLNGVQSVMTLDEDKLVGIPEAGQVDLVNIVSFRFDKDDQGKYQAEDVELYGASVDKYGQFGQVIIESDGLRSALQGFFVAAITSRMLFLRYGLKGLRFDPISSVWTACLLEPGDIVALTCSKVPDREAGMMGVTNKLFAVLDRTWRFTDALVDLLLVDVTYLEKFGFYKYTPAGKADYTVCSSGDKAKYMFLCGDDDKYSNGDTAHNLG